MPTASHITRMTISLQKMKHGSAQVLLDSYLRHAQRLVEQLCHVCLSTNRPSPLPASVSGLSSDLVSPSSQCKHHPRGNQASLVGNAIAEPHERQVMSLDGSTLSQGTRWAFLLLICKTWAIGELLEWGTLYHAPASPKDYSLAQQRLCVDNRS